MALLVDVEKHFDISIPNKEAEKIITVQDFANCVFSKVMVNPSRKCKSQILFYRFRAFLTFKLGIDKMDVTPGSKLKDIIPGSELKIIWKEMEEYISAKLPPLSQMDFDSAPEKETGFLGLKFWTRKNAVTDGNLGDLVNWTLSLNHRRFYDPKSLCSKSEIERIVTGIVSESVGVPVDEIKLSHSITNDLGVD